MQIFSRSLNRLPAIVAAALVFGLGGVTFVMWYYFTPKHTQVGYAPIQPVPYSHRLHVGQLGLDCRYCHIGVERGPVAMVPPAQTCMNCHSQVQFLNRASPVNVTLPSGRNVEVTAPSARLAPVYASFEHREAVPWVRIHRLPDHAYFDHSPHITAGVGCETCHGRIDTMDVVRQVQPLSMSWCLDCHRDPGPNLRPRDQVTTMAGKL